MPNNDQESTENGTSPQLSPQGGEGDHPTADWSARQSEFRSMEWEAAVQLLNAARQLLARFLQEPDLIRPADLPKMLEVASRLGRLATGLSTESFEHPSEIPAASQIEIKSALEKVYGTGSAECGRRSEERK